MQSLFAFLLLLGVLVTIHELGHFLVAKLVGVRVLTFSLGFGPRIVGFRIGETDYRISVLPLGGYVRMYGDDVTEEVPVDQRHRAFFHRGFFAKSAIAAAGPLFNIALAFGLFFAMSLGQEQVPAAVVGTVLSGQAAQAAGLVPGDRIVAINQTPVSVFADLHARVEQSPGVPLTFQVESGGVTRDVVVTPQAQKAPTLFDPDKTVGRIGIMTVREEPVVAARIGSPAWLFGVATGDKITAVNGTSTETPQALWQALDAAAGDWQLTVSRPGTNEPIHIRVPALLDHTGATEEARFAVVKGDFDANYSRVVTATRTLVETAQTASNQRRGLSPVTGLVVHVEPKTVAAEHGLMRLRDVVVAVDGLAVKSPMDLNNALMAAPDAPHAIGIWGGDHARVLLFRQQAHPKRQLSSLKVFGAHLDAAYAQGPMVTRSVGPIEALSRAHIGTREAVLDVFRGFQMMLSGRVGLESVGGPVTIFQLAGNAMAQGKNQFIELMIVISCNLAVFNLLPVPVLDGGHLLMFSIEAITRKRLSEKTRATAVKVGLVLMALLMLTAFHNDFLALFGA